MGTLLFALAIAWPLAVFLHWWPRLPGPLRQQISLVANLAGLGFLIAALRAEGQRELAMTSVVLVGPAYHTDTLSASASVYYYVLTAVCLLLGFAGLAFGDRFARWLTARPLLSAVVVGWLATIVRLLLEKSAAPAQLAQAVGVTWIAPIAGAYLGTSLRRDRPGWRPLLRTLVAYAFLVRGFVALVGIAATRLELGSHYDVSDLTLLPLSLTGEIAPFVHGSWRQLLWLTLLPQLVAWPVYTVVVGMVGGAIALRLSPERDLRSPQRPLAEATSLRADD